MSALFTKPLHLELNRTINTLVMIYDLLYLFLCQSAFEIFNCYKNTDGTYSYFDNPTLRCYSSEWWTRYMPYTFLSIVIYVIPFPILIVYFVHKARTSLKHPHFVAKFNTLYFRFKPDKFYWQTVVVTR